MAHSGLDMAQAHPVPPANGKDASLHDAVRSSALLVDHRHWLRHIPEIAFVADAQGRVIMLNEAFACITGVPLEAGLDQGWQCAVHDADRERLICEWQAATAHANEFTAEFRWRLADGGVRWFSSRAVRRPGPPGCGPRWYGVCVDVDDRKRAKDALQHSEAALRQSLVQRNISERRTRELQDMLTHQGRFSVVGQYATAIAHELNQPLTAAANYLAALRLTLKDSAPEAAELARAAGLQLLRAGGIVQGLRGFVSKGPVKREVQDLRSLLEEAFDVALIGVQDAGVQVRLKLPDEPAYALVNKLQIQQVLVNLVRNALEAMRTVPRKQLEIGLRAQPVDGHECAVICVADTGIGVTDVMGDQLFLPFVSDKDDGMGVGLSISKAIVKSHEGMIWHEAREGGGAVFKFSLPVLNNGE